MRSVADQLREEDARRVLALEPAARIALALKLGDDDAALVAAARGISPAAARRLLARQRQAGRRPSKSAER